MDLDGEQSLLSGPPGFAKSPEAKRFKKDGEGVMEDSPMESGGERFGSGGSGVSGSAGGVSGVGAGAVGLAGGSGGAPSGRRQWAGRRRAGADPTRL